MDDALPVNAPTFTKTYKKLEPKAVREAGERDAAYFRLASYPEWKTFKEDIDALKSRLDDEVAIDKAKDMADFGFRVAVRDLTKTYLNFVVSMVEQSKDYFDKPENE